MSFNVAAPRTAYVRIMYVVVAPFLSRHVLHSHPAVRTTRSSPCLGLGLPSSPLPRRPPSTRARARTRAFSSFSWGPLRSPTTDHPPPHAQDHGTHTARFRHAGWARGCCLYLCLPAFPPANRMDGGRATSGKAPGASPPYHYVLECRSRSGGGTGTGAGRVGLGVTCDRGRFGRGP